MVIGACLLIGLFRLLLGPGTYALAVNRFGVEIRGLKEAPQPVGWQDFTMASVSFFSGALVLRDENRRVIARWGAAVIGNRRKAFECKRVIEDARRIYLRSLEIEAVPSGGGLTCEVK